MALDHTWIDNMLAKSDEQLSALNAESEAKYGKYNIGATQYNREWLLELKATMVETDRYNAMSDGEKEQVYNENGRWLDDLFEKPSE